MTVSLYVAHIALWVAVIFEALAICVLIYKNNQLLTVAASGAAAGRLALGELAPQFQANEWPSNAVVSHETFVGSRTFLLFVTPGCSDCRQLMAGLARALQTGTHVEGLLIYCDGASRGCTNAYQSDWSGMRLLTEHNTKVPELFGVRALPAVVELDATWHVVAYSYPNTVDDVLHLVSEAASSRQS